MSAGCSLDVASLRTMLRDEFGARGRRDMVVARAVQAWYLRQHPELVLLIDQPDLFGIIEGIGAPVPQAGNTLMTRDEFDAEMKKGADMINTQLNAVRYLALRDVPDDQLGAAGVPCIAMPTGPQSGDYWNGADADRLVDEALEYPNAPPFMRGHQWTPEQIAAMTDSTKGPRPPLEFNTIKKGGAQ